MVKGRKASGGWKQTKYLTWDDVKDAIYCATVFSLNVSFDIMPSSGDDRSRKRFIQTFTARFAEAVKRRLGRVAPIGFTVFEKGGPKNRDLHGHFMVRVERRDIDIVERMADGIVVKAQFLRTTKERETKASYITKQRRPLSPAFEARKSHRYESKPAPIPGKRISFNKAAQIVMRSRWEQRAQWKAERQVAHEQLKKNIKAYQSPESGSRARADISC